MTLGRAAPLNLTTMRELAHMTSSGDLPRRFQHASVISGTSASGSISGNTVSASVGRAKDRHPAGEADQFVAGPKELDLVWVCGDFAGAKITGVVVFRRVFDMAMPAGEIAGRPGVNPQLIERFGRDRGPPLA